MKNLHISVLLYFSILLTLKSSQANTTTDVVPSPTSSSCVLEISENGNRNHWINTQVQFR